MKSSFAICENTILFEGSAATCPIRETRRRGGSAGHDDFERGGGRFTGLVGLVAVGGTADGELVTGHAHVGVDAASAGVHAGEPAEVFDVDRLGDRRLRPLVDDKLGSGEIAPDIDCPGPLQLTALDDVEIAVLAVDGHRCRTGDLVRWGRRARSEQGDGEYRGQDDSVPHRITSILADEVLRACSDAILAKRECQYRGLVGVAKTRAGPGDRRWFGGADN